MSIHRLLLAAALLTIAACAHQGPAGLCTLEPDDGQVTCPEGPAQQ